MSAVAEGWVLGLATGAWCLGLCGPLLVPYLVSTGGGRLRHSGLVVVEFLAGRATAYLVLGLLVATLGQTAVQTPAARVVVGLGTIGLALLLLLQGLTRSFADWRPCRRFGDRPWLRRVPFVAGVVFGLSPCPPALLALTALLATGSPLRGAALALAFFVGTTVWLSPVALAGLLGRREYCRGLAEVAVLLSGAWFLVRGALLLAGPGYPPVGGG